MLSRATDRAISFVVMRYAVNDPIPLCQQHWTIMDTETKETLVWRAVDLRGVDAGRIAHALADRLNGVDVALGDEFYKLVAL